MEGDLGLGLVLLAVLLFGWGGLFTWRRFRRDQGAVDPKGAYPGDPKARVMGRVLDAVARSITSDLERTEMSYHPDDPREVLTLIMDIEQFRHLRKHRGLWQHEGIFVERDIERRWARRPPAVREWEGMELVVPIAINAAFNANPSMRIVRFWIGDTENHALTICRVSVEAKRGQSPTMFDWRFDKRAKGYLAPVTPHGDPPTTLSAVGLAEDPYDFEQQVAQMLRGRGLTVEVTGGTGDEGVDIIAYDDTPITGGVSLIQCKRYSPDKKVGVAEVRELYGTMQEKQSAKGVLVTSSAFTAGALRFAEGKSIELIDGARLSEMLVGTEQPVPDVFLEAFDEPTEPSGFVEDKPRDTAAAVPPGGAADYALQVDLNVYAIDGDVSGVRRTLAQGADPNALSDPGNNGILMGALHFAAAHGRTEVARVLLNAGGDMSIRGGTAGFTPLHWAVAYERVETVKFLLERGADMNILNYNGYPPIAGCILRVWEDGSLSQDNRTIIQTLIAAGTNTTPVCGMAQEVGSMELLNLLGCQSEC